MFTFVDLKENPSSLFLDLEMILISLTLRLDQVTPSLALTQDFQVFGWGENVNEQLGLGDKKHILISEKLELPSGLKSGPISIYCGSFTSWILQGDWRPERHPRLLLIQDLNDFEF